MGNKLVRYSMPSRVHRGQHLIAANGTMYDVRLEREPKDEQRCSRHDLTGLTIATLDHVELEPRLLQLLSDRRVADGLDRGDGFVADGSDRRDARARWHAVDMDSACAAQRDAAA
jgi:hypothetical protein